MAIKLAIVKRLSNGSPFSSVPIAGCGKKYSIMEKQPTVRTANKIIVAINFVATLRIGVGHKIRITNKIMKAIPRKIIFIVPKLLWFQLWK